MSLYRTVAEAIAEAGKAETTRGFTFQDMRGNETTYSWKDLEKETAHRAAGLQARDLTKGDRIGLIVIEPEDFVLNFLACLRVGIVPMLVMNRIRFCHISVLYSRFLLPFAVFVPRVRQPS